MVTHLMACTMWCTSLTSKGLVHGVPLLIRASGPHHAMWGPIFVLEGTLQRWRLHALHAQGEPCGSSLLPACSYTPCVQGPADSSGSVRIPTLLSRNGLQCVAYAPAADQHCCNASAASRALL